ncbi:MAG: hypothetical protein DI616_01130 [Paracoccus denitrificans]|uniref:Lipoprotein n=1 Tax=Paracoccus denitrificans TaxID=266 RepID=A0A533IGD2_PARDE|nr:MAG: hypothetical protein DI616_01130 [Paracoccus denitrificans]
MKLRYAVALLPLGLAACDEQAMQDIRMPWDQPEAEAPATPVDPMSQPLVAPSVSPNEVPIEVEGERKQVATAESKTLNAAGFVARGNEPFWRVDVSGTTAKFITPENQAGTNVTVRRIVYQQGVEYIGERGGASFSLNIRNVACTDSMSGEKFPMTAVIRNGSLRGQGCASPIEAAAAAPASQG